MKSRIKWDISYQDGVPAITFNDNGIWIEYGISISPERLKTVTRTIIGSKVEIKTVRACPLSEIGEQNCKYSMIHTRNRIYIARPGEEMRRLGYIPFTDADLAALLGNPSRLLSDYWDELYESSPKRYIDIKWADGNERELNDDAFDHVGRKISTNVLSGEYFQIDETNGNRYDFSWQVQTRLTSMIKRELWLAKGNILPPYADEIF